VAQVEGERIAVGNRAHLLSFGIEAPPEAQGVQGMSVLVAVGNRCYGSISIEDQVRTSVVGAVKELEAMNIRVILLTGDSQAAAEQIASQMGIFHFHAELLPEQKAVEVAVQTKRGHTVAMVGDGIN